MISIDHSKKTIYLMASEDMIKEVDSALSDKKWAKGLGGTYSIGEHYLDELSCALRPMSKKLQMTDRFKRYAAFFRENSTEEKEGKNKVIVYVYPNRSVIKTRFFPAEELDKKMKYFFKPAVNMKKYKEGRWDGYFHLFDKRSRTFPTGLLHMAKEIFEKKGYGYKIVYKYERRPEKKFDWYVDDGITPDPDQIEAVKAAYDAGRSVVKAPTGFGKTAVLAKRLTALFGVRTLFVANKKSLLDDAKVEFVEGIVGLEEKDVGEVKDGIFGNTKITSTTTIEDIPDLDQPVMVATIQSLDAKLKDPRTRKKLKEWLKGVEFLMVDETQSIGTRTWDDVLDNVYAPYRVLLSATPKRTDGATIKIFARGGELAFFTTAEEQIEKGRLSEVEIIYKVYDHKLYNQGDDSIVYHEAYSEWISNNEERNVEFVVKPALEMVAEGRHVLVLFQFIEHGEILRDLLIQHGLAEDEVRFIYGETPDKVRRNAIKEFRKGNFKVLVGSTIFDAGVNIPLISGIVMAGAGNSEITLVQRIGRGVRNADYEELLGYMPEFMLETDGDKVAKIIDVYDTNVKFFENQARNRYNTAKGEFGPSRVRVEGRIVRPEKKTKAEKASHEQLQMKLEDMKEGLKGFERDSEATSIDDLDMDIGEVAKLFKERF